MPQFVIERTMPGVGKLTPEELRAASQTSCAVLNGLPAVQWVHSYVTDDKLYCIYRAPTADLVREHAAKAGFPADPVSVIRTIVDPTTAE